jgi:hypothetical protein
MSKEMLKVLEVLGKEIINLELDKDVKVYEIKRLEQKLKNVEDYVKKLEVENGK